jgi:hypothetical protein
LEHDGLGPTVGGRVVGGCVVVDGGLGGSVVGDVVVGGTVVGGAFAAGVGPWHAANSTTVAAEATMTTPRTALTTATPIQPGTYRDNMPWLTDGTVPI